MLHCHLLKRFPHIKAGVITINTTRNAYNTENINSMTIMAKTRMFTAVNRYEKLEKIHKRTKHPVDT